MRIPFYIAAALFLWTTTLAQATDKAAIPVREVTVFKDGHAFILHEGTMPTDPQGDVLLDALPEPVIGTFWPYSGDPSVSLVSVVAGRRTLSVRRTALTLRELLEANVGKQARHQVRYLFIGKSGAILLGFPDTTQDADLFVETKPDNGRAIVAALRELGFALTEQQAAQIERGKDFVQLKNGPFDLDLVH